VGAAHLSTIRAVRCQIKCADFCKSEVLSSQNKRRFAGSSVWGKTNNFLIFTLYRRQGIPWGEIFREAAGEITELGAICNRSQLETFCSFRAKRVWLRLDRAAVCES
jgi:hypothetical protein